MFEVTEKGHKKHFVAMNPPHAARLKKQLGRYKKLHIYNDHTFTAKHISRFAVFYVIMYETLCMFKIRTYYCTCICLCYSQYLFNALSYLSFSYSNKYNCSVCNEKISGLFGKQAYVCRGN